MGNNGAADIADFPSLGAGAGAKFAFLAAEQLAFAPPEKRVEAHVFAQFAHVEPEGCAHHAVPRQRIFPEVEHRILIRHDTSLCPDGRFPRPAGKYPTARNRDLAPSAQHVAQPRSPVGPRHRIGVEIEDERMARFVQGEIARIGQAAQRAGDHAEFEVSACESGGVKRTVDILFDEQHFTAHTFLFECVADSAADKFVGLGIAGQRNRDRRPRVPLLCSLVH